MGTRYVAIAKRLGPIPIGAEKLGERELPPFLLVGESLEGLRSKLADTNVVVHEGLIVDAGTYQHPLLVHEGYRGFNIVKYQSRWYAISQQAGPIDLQTADTTQLCTTGRVMEADSQEAVQQLVDGQTVEAAEHTPARHALDRAMDDLRSQLQDSAAAARTLIKDLEAVKSQLQDNAAGTRTLLEELQVLRGERDQLRATCRDLGTIRDSIEPQRVRQGRARRPRTGPDGGSGKERG
jgi:hypothetical protein